MFVRDFGLTNFRPWRVHSLEIHPAQAHTAREVQIHHFVAILMAVLQLCRSGLICWADAPGIIGLLSLQVAPI